MRNKLIILFIAVTSVGFVFSQRVSVTGGYGYGRSYGGYGGGHYGFYSPGWYQPYGYGVGAIGYGAVIIITPETEADPDIGKIYYDKGLFYEKTERGYVVIPAPPGAKIPNIPEGYTLIKQGTRDFYYVAGTFYSLNTEGTYEVSRAPIGAKVPYLPKEGLNEEVYNESTYYILNDVYYLPIRTGTKVMYKIMPKPGTNANDHANDLVKQKNNFPDYVYSPYLGVDYYYLDGKFYVAEKSGQKLIEVIAPVGISVQKLPKKGVEKIEGKDGNLYDKFESTYFQAKVANGTYTYIVVNKPN